MWEFGVIICVYGIEIDVCKMIVLVGGLYLEYWFLVFEKLVFEYKWRIVVVMKSGCVFMIGIVNNFLCL